VFTLPPEMIKFYKKNIEYITEHAVDPDKRRYAVEGEAPRHYIDIDHYAEDGQDPFEVMPKNGTMQLINLRKTPCRPMELFLGMLILWYYNLQKPLRQKITIELLKFQPI